MTGGSDATRTAYTGKGDRRTLEQSNNSTSSQSSSSSGSSSSHHDEECNSSRGSRDGSMSVSRSKVSDGGEWLRVGPALISGAVQAVLFNPVDRALYLRVMYRRRSLLDRRNFERPFQGFMNAAVYRTLVGASYFYVQDTFRLYICNHLPHRFQADVSPQLNALLIGFVAGSLNGLTLNGLQAVKFRMWNSDERRVTFMRTARQMYHEAGSRIFLRGCLATMVRDCVFGVIYETVRHSSHFTRSTLHHASTASPAPPVLATATGTAGDSDTSATCEATPTAEALPAAAMTAPSSRLRARSGLHAFMVNLLAAIIASVLSSPLNYVRSIIYGTPYAAIPMGLVELLRSFFTQCIYTYRHGVSYVDRHATAELAQATAAAAPKAGAGGGRGAPSSKLPGKRAVPRNALDAAAGGGRGAGPRVVRGVAHTGHHPRAMWRWANMRLNIGWGSLRVGLGMAIGQSCFYIAQDALYYYQYGYMPS